MNYAKQFSYSCFSAALVPKVIFHIRIHEPNQPATPGITTLQSLIWSKKYAEKSEKRQSYKTEGKNYNEALQTKIEIKTMGKYKNQGKDADCKDTNNVF